jgi:hypothetical protein
MRYITLGLTLLALLPGGCELTTGSQEVTSATGLSIRAGSGQLVLRNDLAEPVHYVAVEAETATLIDLYFDPSMWPAVASRTTVRLRYEQVTGYSPGDEEAVVFLWTAGRGYDQVRVRLR